jgi:hypothetical protein
MVPRIKCEAEERKPQQNRACPPIESSQHTKNAGTDGVQVILSDACLGLAEYAAKRLSASFARCGGAAGTITALVRSAWGSAQSEAAFIANSAILLNSTPSV